MVLASYLLTFGLFGSLGLRDYLIENYSRLVDFVVFLLLYIIAFFGFVYFIDWLWRKLGIENKK